MMNDPVSSSEESCAKQWSWDTPLVSMISNEYSVSASIGLGIKTSIF